MLAPSSISRDTQKWRKVWKLNARRQTCLLQRGLQLTLTDDERTHRVAKRVRKHQVVIGDEPARDLVLLQRLASSRKDRH